VSWCIVVVQHPTLVRPQLRPLPSYGFPQTLQNLYIKNFLRNFRLHLRCK
jgi:hypothetical protein